MADFKCHPMLLVTPEQVKAIREDVGLTDLESLKEVMEHVSEWFAKENHLPNMTLDEKVIENMYISRKCSLEQTKRKLDMLFTMKSLLPDYVIPRDPLCPTMERIFENCHVVPLPKLAPDNTRITVFQIRHPDPDKFICMDWARLMNLVFEYRLHNDYAAGDRLLADYGNLTLPIVLKLTPTYFKNLEIFLTRCYGGRMKGIHIINAPSFINRIMTIFKIGFKPKLFNRIVVHNSLEDLHAVLPKDILPKDFGGIEPAIDDIAAEWYKEFCKPENRQFFIESEKWKSDESKRIGGGMTSGEFGVNGTFRQLEVF